MPSGNDVMADIRSQRNSSSKHKLEFTVAACVCALELFFSCCEFCFHDISVLASDCRRSDGLPSTDLHTPSAAGRSDSGL